MDVFRENPHLTIEEYTHQANRRLNAEILRWLDDLARRKQVPTGEAEASQASCSDVAVVPATDDRNA